MCVIKFGWNRGGVVLSRILSSDYNSVFNIYLQVVL